MCLIRSSQSIPGTNERVARNYVEGNGEVVTIKDVTGYYPISAEKAGVALRQAGFGRSETDFIV